MVATPTLTVDAKLARPRPPLVLNRERLLDQLLNGLPGNPLTLICAGAGYGKTTLLSSLADAYKGGILWYSLGPEDADVSVFLSHVVASLRRHSWRYGRTLLSFLQEAHGELRGAATAAGALLNDLSRIRDPMLFIMDDFHAVTGNRDLMSLMSIVIENNKSPVHFALASRTEPPLPLGRLRARRQVQEFGSSDLAFTGAELRSFLEQVHGRSVSDQEIETITRLTEGWVTPVQLALQMTGNAATELPRALERANRSGSALHDYLAQEVLSDQSEDMRRWMLRTCAFEELDGPLLTAVLGEADPEDRLNEMSRRQILSVFDGAEGRVYRYHTLLRSFLQRRFRAEIPEAERDRLHETAARYFEGRRDLVRAAAQLSMCASPDRLMSFIEKNALQFLDRGHYKALLGWMDMLPRSTFEANAWLRLRRGDCRHYLGEWPEAELDYELALDQFKLRTDDVGEAWAVLGLARIWNLRGQAERAAAEGGGALRKIDHRQENGLEELSARLLQVVSGAEFYLGHYREALKLLDRLEKVTRADTGRQAALWNNRAVVWGSQGNFQAAAKALEKGLQRPGARRSPRAPLHLSNLALLFSDMGDSQRAASLFQEALRLARSFQNKTQILSCLTGQAQLFHHNGDLDRSLDAIREAEALNAELKVPLIESGCLALRASILAQSGQFGAAREALSQALVTYGASTRDAIWLAYRVQAASVDLKAGRVTEAMDELRDLLVAAEEMEALHPRAVLLFYLGESLRLLGQPGAEEHLSRALELGRDLGYNAFFKWELRRSFEPFGFLLERGRECPYIARLATTSGSNVESLFNPYIGRNDLPGETVGAVLSVLAEVGGPVSHKALSESGWSESPAWRLAVRNCLRAMERRHGDLREPLRPAQKGVTITTLGRFSLATPQGMMNPESWKSQRALNMFVYLAIRAGRETSKDRLIELFWPGKHMRRAAQNFHPTLSYARRALRGVSNVAPYLLETGAAYVINPALNVNVDVRRFEGLVNEARSRKKRPEKLSSYEEAFSLYRGDFMEGRYEPWTEEIRTQLSALFESALAEAGALYYEACDYHRAASRYEMLLQRSPYQEEVHARLMMCYHKVGDQAAIRVHYQRLTRILHEDLGVEPLPETTRVYRSLVGN